MSTSECQCLECGNRITAPRNGQEFCSSRCRLSFNNRRMQRGAELYDLFRALRRERDTAKAMNLWTHICRLELAWQTDDESKRPGRRSYMPPKKALANLFDKGLLQRGDVLVKGVRPRVAAQINGAAVVQ